MKTKKSKQKKFKRLKRLNYVIVSHYVMPTLKYCYKLKEFMCCNVIPVSRRYNLFLRFLDSSQVDERYRVFPSFGQPPVLYQHFSFCFNDNALKK